MKLIIYIETKNFLRYYTGARNACKPTLNRKFSVPGNENQYQNYRRILICLLKREFSADA